MSKDNQPPQITGETYRERCKSQLLHWKDGTSIHNSVDNECCPDFSCCKPKLKQSDEVRKTFYYAKREQKDSMLFAFLSSALGGEKVKVVIVNGKDELGQMLN